MARANQPFEFKTVDFVMAHKGHQKKFQKLLSEGWEVVDETKVGAFGSRKTFTLRRANPKFSAPQAG